MLRLLVRSILQCSYGNFIAVIGICCSSFTVVSRHSSGRDYILPDGNPFFDNVVAANCMLARPDHCQAMFGGKRNDPSFCVWPWTGAVSWYCSYRRPEVAQ